MGRYAMHALIPFFTACVLIPTLFFDAGLLCLAQAKEGGLSAWSSSVTVHNEIVKRAPELARVLAQRGAW